MLDRESADLTQLLKDALPNLILVGMVAAFVVVIVVIGRRRAT
jgi:hypothetical protein